MIWKSKEYMPGNEDNICFTSGNVKYRYAIRVSSDLYQEVHDDQKIFVIIYGGHYGKIKRPLMFIVSESVTIHVRIYPNPIGRTLKGQ